MNEKKSGIFQISKDDYHRFHDSVLASANVINSYRAFILLLLAALIEFSLIIGYDIPFIASNGTSKGHIIEYTITHSVLVFIALIGAHFAYDYHKNGKFTLFPQISFQFLQAAFLILFISGIAYINALDQATTSSITIYISFIIIISIVTVMELKYAIITFLIPHLLFIVGMFLYQEDSALRLFNIINGSTFMLTSIVISFIIYNNFFQLTKNRILLEEANNRLEHLSNTDSLTKIYNRRFGLKRLSEEISRSNRTNHDLAVMLVDIDDFKNINDTFGHVAGDYTLSSFTRVIESQLRKEDVFMRYGGEEFLVILPETNQDGAMVVAEKIRNMIASSIFSYQDKEYQITVSIGIAMYPKKRVDEVNTLIDIADKNLYTSKRNGKNQTTI